MTCTKYQEQMYLFIDEGRRLNQMSTILSDHEQRDMAAVSLELDTKMSYLGSIQTILVTTMETRR